MSHHHVWQKEPPDGITRDGDERYGDLRDMAHNSFWTSREELQRLRLLLKKNPNFENSTDWPTVVERCSSCAITRGSSWFCWRRRSRCSRWRGALPTSRWMRKRLSVMSVLKRQGRNHGGEVVKAAGKGGCWPTSSCSVAHSQAWTANVQTSEQPGDRRQVYQGRVAGGVYLATFEGEGGGGYQGGETGGDCHA